MSVGGESHRGSERRDLEEADLSCRFHECESYFGEGELKLLDTVGDCPRGEVFCPIVGACGAEEACPQKCDRTCQ